jgi:predicted Rdx family selenoprotein
VAAEIEKELGLRSTFVPGGGGIFEVRLDGELVYTNERKGGVPPAGPVIAALQEADAGESE